MNQYNLVLPEFKTQAGQFSIIEEKTQQRSQRYYALEVSPGFDQSQLRVEVDNKKLFEEHKCFRLYEQMITFNNKTQYLFKYVEGQRQSIEQLIEKTKNNLEQEKKVPIEKINILLSQVLECLYQLHKLNILGRQFSTHNILECDGRVIMMDFGFCPALLESDFSYLFPPELDYFSQRNNLFQNLEVYTSKLDSWLLGAFLYHLVKLNPISRATRNSTHILAHTERYQGIGICEFIQQLLIFNSKDRLSFFNIYESNYVQRLQLQRPISEYQNFYQGFENSQPLIENIRTRDYLTEESFFDSRHIIINQSQIQGQLELMSLEFTNSNQPSIQVDNESSQLPNSDLRSVTKEFFFKPHSIQTSRYYKFWYFINYQQYRCYFLLNTVDEIVNKLADKNLEVEILASYILKKMCYLILVELMAQLKQIKCPWGDDQKLWEQFKQDNQFILLIQALEEKKQKFQITLKSLFSNGCLRYVNDQRLDEQLRNSLRNDLNTDFSYFNGQISEDFLTSGFRQMTICIFNFLMNICNLFEDLRLTQYTLILKVVCCHLINRIFTIELQTNFQNLRPQYGLQLLPDDINDFISHQNLKREKIRQIQYLLDLYFYRREQR